MSRSVSVSREDGFTLIELLVALALTAVIAATMTAAIMQLRPIRAFEARIDEQQIVSTLVEVVERDLQGALRIPLLEAGGNTSLLMRGEPRRITFTAVVPVGYHRNSLREVTYSLEKNDHGSRLIRTAKVRRFSQQQIDAGTQTDELYSGPLTLSFAYLLSDMERKVVWAQEFAELNKLPQAVMVEIGTPRKQAHARRKVIRYLEDQ